MQKKLKKGDKVVVKGENRVLEICDIFGKQIHFGPCHPPVHVDKLLRHEEDDN